MILVEGVRYTVYMWRSENNSVDLGLSYLYSHFAGITLDFPHFHQVLGAEWNVGCPHTW